MAVTAIDSALVSWAEYKAIFGLSDDSEQDKYQTLINQASAVMESYCRRLLKSRTFNDQLMDGSGRSAIVFPHRPLQSISAINIDTSRAFAMGTALALDDYDFDKQAGILWLRSGVCPPGRRIVKTTFEAGYKSTDPEYPTLQTACLELVKWMASRYSGFIGKRTETSADGMNVSFEIEMPLNVRSMLQPFMEASI